MRGGAVRDRHDRGAARAQVPRRQLAHLAGADEQDGAARRGRRRPAARARRRRPAPRLGSRRSRSRPGRGGRRAAPAGRGGRAAGRSARARTRRAPGRGSRPRRARASRARRRRGRGAARRCRRRAGRGPGRAPRRRRRRARAARRRARSSRWRRPARRWRGRARCGCTSRARPPRTPRPGAGQRAGERRGAVRVHGDALPQLDGGLAMRDADESELHDAKWVRGRTTATSANPARRRTAKRRPCRPGLAAEDEAGRVQHPDGERDRHRHVEVAAVEAGETDDDAAGQERERDATVRAESRSSDSSGGTRRRSTRASRRFSRRSSQR